ncbi:hypothetical protein [Coleofasciculus sp. E2-BRE-01]
MLAVLIIKVISVVLAIKTQLVRRLVRFMGIKTASRIMGLLILALNPNG